MKRRIIILEDDESLRLVISRALTRAGYEVRATASPDAAIDRLARRDADALIADVILGQENFLERLEEAAAVNPDAPVIVISAQTTAATAIRAAQRGAFEYLPKPFDLDVLVETMDRALQRKEGGQRTRRADSYSGLVGESEAMQDVFRTIARLANSREPAIFSGPSGSGRAAAARTLHAASRIRGGFQEAGPALLEDDFSGVFAETGPDDDVLLRRAEEWTSGVQARLLELAEREDKPRLLATLDIEQSHKVRRDLLARLSTGRVALPRLGARGRDAVLLFEHFFEEASQNTPQLTDSAVEFLTTHPWPGEVLELEQAARRLAAEDDRKPVTVERLRAAAISPGATDPVEALEAAAANFAALAMAEGRDDVAEQARSACDRGLIRTALSAAGGVRREAAQLLGLNRNTLAARIASLKLDGGED